MSSAQGRFLLKFRAKPFVLGTEGFDFTHGQSPAAHDQSRPRFRPASGAGR